ncbi:MAG: hypothetical protein AAFR38_09980 [Planctomycetota bacterium]
MSQDGVEERAGAGRRARRLIVAVGLVAAAGVTVAVVAGTQLSRLSPLWWRPLDPSDQRVVTRALVQENQAISTLHRVRPGSWTDLGDRTVWLSEPWFHEIDDESATAWLSGRLPGWLAAEFGLDEWPEELSEVQVDFADGAIRVGARLGGRERGRVLSATLRPRVDDDGSLWLDAAGVAVGRLPLPTWWVIGEAKAGAAERLPDLDGLPDAGVVADALMGREPVMDSAVLRLADGRRVRLLAIRVRNGKLEVLCQTELRSEVAAR